MTLNMRNERSDDVMNPTAHSSSPQIVKIVVKII